MKKRNVLFFVVITICICLIILSTAHGDETQKVMKHLYPEGPVRLDLLAPDPERERIRNLPGNRWGYIPLGPGETPDTAPDPTLYENKKKEEQEKLIKVLE